MPLRIAAGVVDTQGSAGASQRALMDSPARAGRPDFGRLQDVEDRTALGVRIGDAVVGPRDRGLALGPRVGRAGRRVPAQVVAEEEVLALPPRTGVADVDVD